MKPTKQCKISQKKFTVGPGGGAVAPPPPPLKYATVSVCNDTKARFSGLVTEGGQNKPQIWYPDPNLPIHCTTFIELR